MPDNSQRQASYTIDPHTPSAIDQIFDPMIAAHPGLSGVSLLHEPEAALRARNAMTALAEHSLDVQTYIWANDKAGRILTQRLLEAADRGVRVRILLDDFTLATADKYLAALASHPLLEIRIFNPIARRSSKSLGFITEIKRVNQRMHNKLFILDNKVAIAGGRNLGDNYFGIKDSYNSRDIDVITIGPVVNEISQSFDEYWNSDWAYPVDKIYTRDMDEQDIEALRQELKQQSIIDFSSTPFELDNNKEAMINRAINYEDHFVWAPIQVIFDRAEKLRGDNKNVAVQFATVIGEVENEMLAEIAYFVPGNDVVSSFADASEKGIRIRFLTNSMTSTEVLPAYAGFSSYRKQLLEAGVELYEYRSDAEERQTWPEPSHNSPSRLHSKTFVVDQRYSFIGSFNFDPRSVDLNTEIGLLIDSREFAAQVTEVLNEGVRPGNAWKLQLDENDKVQWLNQENGELWSKAPYSSWWQRFQTGFLRMLPIESQL
ncbi:phospholipase D family protein [Agaribacterium haliotis]|uniref:phospholipase D family protein n=1 Tax=Agaribacterium haliotis TaxID=2013869 RepID=UPI001304328C|nr:phospholipase D family protein [Agaribacterium haliotis]